VVTFALTGHRRRLRVAVHAVALAAWAAAGLLLIGAPLPAAAVWLAAGGALFWNAVRRGAGRETLTVTPQFLVLRRRVGPFRLTRRYSLDSVTDAHDLREPGLAADRRRIEFVCGGRARRFGRNLTARESSCIVDLIRRSAGLPQ
jgi:hypothetical protein